MDPIVEHFRNTLQRMLRNTPRFLQPKQELIDDAASDIAEGIRLAIAEHATQLAQAVNDAGRAA